MKGWDILREIYNNIDWNEYFIYDETSPSCLRWAIDKRCVKAFDSAGSKTYSDKEKTKPKCWDVRLNGVLYKVHIIVWLLNRPYIDSDLVINHKDCNPFNNKINNLENVTQSDNMRRCKSHKNILQVDNTSGANGVSVLLRGGEIFGYQAGTRLQDGETEAFVFSVKRYGKELALVLASTAREFQIQKLKDIGIQYG